MSRTVALRRDKHTPRPTDQKRPARPCWTEIRRLAAQERAHIGEIKRVRALNRQVT
eukprot:COSAG01_NODE_4132_length_5322_cov_3.930308_5_plen_56_part_00